MAAKQTGSVHTGEQGCLAGSTLGQAVDSKTGVKSTTEEVGALHMHACSERRADKLANRVGNPALGLPA